MSNHPTRKPRSRKAADRPKKPYAEFPLTPHASGKWMKKIRGKIYYFGNWAKRVDGKLVRVEGDGWEQALALYKAQADDLHAGRTPQIASDELLVKELCNHFLTAMQKRLDERRRMSPRMFKEYRATTDRIVRVFGGTRRVSGLAAADFSKLMSDLTKQYGPVRLGNEVQKVRTIFNYGTTNDLIKTPINYGSEFVKPDKSELRKHRAKRGKRMFEATELRNLVAAADVQLKAMILLGINVAFGNADCGHLTPTALDLDGGWATFPRPKTGIERRAFLWPETVAAVKEAIAARPTPKDQADADKVFITKYGNAWTDGGMSSAVTHEMTKLLKELGIHRPGLNFYALRHTFRTVADNTRDFPAVRLVMGHADASIDDVYREQIDDARLVAVAEHVRQWLFGKPADCGGDEGEGDAAHEPNADTMPDNSEQPRLKLFAG